MRYCRFPTCWRAIYNYQSTINGIRLQSGLLHIWQQLILMQIAQRIVFRVSSRKFYQVAQERSARNIPKTPEEAIISKYLTNKTTYQKYQTEAQPPSSSKAKLQSKQVNYRQFVSSNPHGCVIQKQYKNISLSMFSLDFRKIQLSQIYSLCEKVKPDVLLVQARPDAYLSNFKLLPKSDGIFSDRLYLEQITMRPQAINQCLVDRDIERRLEEMLKPNEEKQGLGEKAYIRDFKEIIDDEIIVMAGHYAKKNNIELILGELPQQPWRQWFCNSHTLMEMTEIFKNISKNIPFYQSIAPTPYRLGCIIQPSIFLNIRDRYMATLIEMLIGSYKHKKIMCIMGVLQNQAVDQILTQNLLLRQQGGQEQFTPLLEYLIGPEVKHSVLRNVNQWQIIQKHILCDVMQYGSEIKNIPLETMQTTSKIAQFYGQRIKNFSTQLLLKFYFDKTEKHLKIMYQKIEDGMQLKKKFALREAMRIQEIQN